MPAPEVVAPVVDCNTVVCGEVEGAVVVERVKLVDDAAVVAEQLPSPVMK